MDQVNVRLNLKKGQKGPFFRPAEGKSLLGHWLPPGEHPSVPLRLCPSINFLRAAVATGDNHGSISLIHSRARIPGSTMASKATVYKVELQISDMDRHYYATHAFTLAQHPSETDERLMIRLLVFALHAQERLEFGRGISSDDEPDLWLRSLTGEIELWVDLGQPDEARIRRACGRARQVAIVTYSGRGADLCRHGVADPGSPSRRCRLARRLDYIITGVVPAGTTP